MTDFIFIVEAFLDGQGIAHSRDKIGTVAFELPFGTTSFECSVNQFGQTLCVSALWCGVIAPDHINAAQRLLLRLIDAGAQLGQTHLNPRRGLLKYNSSVDLGMVDFTIDRVGQVLETLLEPFNIKILAMEMALNQKMTADVVVESYAAWDRRRIAEMMGRAVDDGPVDPSSN